MRWSAMLAAALLLAAPPLRAQANGDGARPGWSVDRAMQALMGDFDRRHRAYFPRRGTWDYVTRHRDHIGAIHRGIHRFPAAQTDSAIHGPNGPLCDEFQHGDAIAMGSLVWYAIEPGIRWRRVSATRFQVRNPIPDETVFVDWRREDGRWVIAAIGSLSDYVPPAPVAAQPPRDTLAGRRLRLPLAADAGVAEGAAWYRDDEAIAIDTHRRSKYGLPRTLRERDLVYYATFRGVDVYVEPSALHARPSPEVVYLPVDRTGTFQPYVGYFTNGCG